MLPDILLFLLAQVEEKDGGAPPVLRPSPHARLGAPSALGALEDELIALRRALRPALVQVKIPLPAEDGRPARELLVSGIVIDRGDLVVAPGQMPWRDGRVVVVRFDGQEFPALPIAEDVTYGLTLLQAAGLGVEPPPLGQCDALPEGSVTVGLGNAYGLVASLSLGFISGKERTIGAMEHLLQVTNAVNPGDGGGLLADRRGQVIAILRTSMAEVERWQFDRQQEPADHGSAGSQDISFAVPIERVLEAFHGHLSLTVRSRRQLGVVISEEFDPRLQRAGGSGTVLVVREVLPDSPAARAGVNVGDRLLRVDDQAVESFVCLSGALAGAGESPELEVLRGEERFSIRIDLPVAAAPRH